MKVIEMLAKGMKVIPVSKIEEWRYNYLCIEDDTIALKDIKDSRNDFYYDYIDIEWLMDEGIEYIEKHKKYFISHRGKLFAIREESVDDVLISKKVGCNDLECENVCLCSECSINKSHDIDGYYIKLHMIEY